MNAMVLVCLAVGVGILAGVLVLLSRRGKRS